MDEFTKCAKATVMNTIMTLWESKGISKQLYIYTSALNCGTAEQTPVGKARPRKA